MLSNRIAAALFGAGALLVTGLAAAPANAAPIAAGSVPATTGQIEQVQYYGRPYYGPRRYYGRPVYRPRCFFVDRRVWNGWRWVEQCYHTGPRYYAPLRFYHHHHRHHRWHHRHHHHRHHHHHHRRHHHHW